MSLYPCSVGWKLSQKRYLVSFEHVGLSLLQNIAISTVPVAQQPLSTTSNPETNLRNVSNKLRTSLTYLLGVVLIEVIWEIG